MRIVSGPERVDYDEFGLFHENASEFALPYDRPPSVRRTAVEIEPGRSLSALVWGDGEPELVLLHGGEQNAHTWDTVAMALRPRPLVAIDLPGHGHSGGPGLQQVAGAGPRAAATDIAVAVRALAPAADAVVGMSFGGVTALALADQDPELVRRLVLVDVFPGLAPERSRHIAEFVAGPATFASFDDLFARTKGFNPDRTDSSLRRGILHNAQQLPDGTWVWRHSRWRIDRPEEAARYEESLIRALDIASGDPDDPVEATMPATPGGPTFGELLDAARRLTVPTMLARGMRPDSVLRDDDEERFLETVPGGVVRRFPDAGHSIQGDMPIELAAAIAELAPHS